VGVVSGWRGEPVAHTHEGEHTHDPVESDPEVRAYVTTVTLAIAHPGNVSPERAVARVSEVLEEAGLEGLVVGVASVELRGPGGLIGL
jgi:hypothetical protein